MIHTCGRRAGSVSLIHGDMNSETGVLLRSMPPGHNMNMGKGYDDDDWLRQSSLS